MSNQSRQPPLYGRPPYATDEDDSVYDQVPQNQPRPRQRQPEQPPNGGRDSMYQAWDNYLHTDKDARPNSGVGGIGMGLMAGDMDDSDDDDAPTQRNNFKSTAPAKSSNLRPSPAQEQPKRSFEAQRQQPPPMNNMNNGRQPIARPPAAAAPPSAVRSPFSRPPPGQQQQQQPPMAHPVPRQVQRPAAAALRVDVPNPAMPIPRAPIPAFMPSPSPSPSLNPHPLNAPSTPITPVFARPSFQGPEREVKFAKDAIMRGNSEETLLPRTTKNGDEFWRRFSYFAKEDPKASKSSWLKSTVGSNRNMSRWVWCISIFLLLAIGGGIGFGWWATHSAPAAVPLAVGGSANESQLSTATQAAATTNAAAAGTSRTLIPVTAASRRDLGDYAYFEEERRSEPTPPAVAPGSRSHKRNRLNRLALDALD